MSLELIMRHVQFDLTTYNQTKGTGTPLYAVVEEEIPEIEIFRDENGKPTLGGIIGYALAYLLMAAFLGALFIYL